MHAEDSRRWRQALRMQAKGIFDSVEALVGREQAFDVAARQKQRASWCFYGSDEGVHFAPQNLRPHQRGPRRAWAKCLDTDRVSALTRGVTLLQFCDHINIFVASAVTQWMKNPRPSRGA
jgi:hypothetical protein